MDSRKQSAESSDRRARIQELRQKQESAERRRKMAVVGIAGLAGVGLIAAVAVPLAMQQKEQSKPLASYGVPAARAGCDPIVNDPAEGVAVHVGPGTNKPDVTRVNYKTVPPSSGEHFPVWASPQRHFYTASDRPRTENLVHNLEHGYTVVWYDDTVQGAQLEALKELADRIPRDPRTTKFIVSAWDASYGAFPAGKHVALSHWGATQGHRMLCSQVSGGAIADFMQKFPQTDAPEPNAP